MLASSASNESSTEKNGWAIVKNSNTLVVFINQIRMKIGVMFEVLKQRQEEMPLSFIRP